MKEGREEGRPMYTFLSEDLELLDRAIARMGNSFQEEGKEMGASMGESAETYHDNAAFEIGWRTQEQLLARSDELRKIRENARVVKPNPSNERVSLGKTVTIKNIDTGEEHTYTIGSYLVLGDNPNRISYDSPLARVIMNAEVGDERDGMIAGQHRTFEIVSIS